MQPSIFNVRVPLPERNEVFLMNTLNDAQLLVSPDVTALLDRFVWGAVRHEEGLGMGDVKMLAMIGAFVGWKLTLLTLMFSSFAGTIIGLALIVTRRGTMKYALPFGTFLAIGAAVSATAGPMLLDWYFRLW